MADKSRNEKDSDFDKELDDDLKNWDPMGSASSSFRNTMSYRIDDPGAMLTGGQQSPQSIPCPFQKEPFKPCYKGRSCKYKHGKYTPAMLKGRPKLSSAAVECTRDLLLADNLPKKCQPAQGFISLALITNSISPSEFYLLPKDNWKCLCGSAPSGSDDDDDDEDSRGLELSKNASDFNQFEILWKRMQKHYSLKRYQPLSYLAGELVAVKVQLSNGKGWVRGVVLNDTLNDILEDEKPPKVSLKLLDYGLDLVKSVVDVVPLNEDFCYIGPLSYNCQLYGISPLLGKWGRKASQFFQELTAGQILIAEVKKTNPSCGSGLFGIFDNSPMLLNLYVKYKGKYINISKLMCEEGLGLQWNPFPFRPSVAEVLDPYKHEYAIKAQNCSEDQFLPILERERSRLKRYVERLKYQHGMD